MSILLRFFMCSICDVIRKTEETIRMRIWAYVVSLFYQLNEFQNFINGIMGLYTTQPKYLHYKLRINFSMTPPFIVQAYIQYIYIRIQSFGDKCIAA